MTEQAEPVCSACVMFAAVLEAIEHRFHESMRASDWLNLHLTTPLPCVLCAGSSDQLNLEINKLCHDVSNEKADMRFIIRANPVLD